MAANKFRIKNLYNIYNYFSILLIVYLTNYNSAAVEIFKNILGLLKAYLTKTFYENGSKS